MQKALRLPQVFGVLILKIGLFILLLFAFVSIANADTVFEDIKVELGIEIGNGVEDYADKDLVIEKGRFVTYRIKVKNSGSNSHNDLLLLMNTPLYMEYIPDSTVMQNENFSYSYPIPDIDEYSSLEIGYDMSLSAGEELIIELQFQVVVDEEIKDDSLYTFAFASVFGEHSAIPVLSEAIETTISGEAKPTIQGTVEVSPDIETQVIPGMTITYTYDLHNIGGIATSDMTLVTNIPENTTCISGCGEITLDSLDPNGSISHEMIVQVNPDITGVPEITGGSAYVIGDNFEQFDFPEEIVHSTNESSSGSDQELGDFILIINQVPNVVLNSADGVYARPDGADRSETQYVYYYQGRGQTYTYPTIKNDTTDFFPGSHDQCQRSYPYKRGSSMTYSYNSANTPIPADCEDRSGCPLIIESTPVVFNITTTIPEYSPEFVFTENSKDIIYPRESDEERATQITTYDVPFETNSFMRYGTSDNFMPINNERITEIRGVRNGSYGIVDTAVNAVVVEELWQYQQYTTRECTYHYECGDETCHGTIDVPYYHWVRYPSNVYLPSPDGTKATDEANISVYTSTAWLKTQGGHIGTNGSFTNEDGEFNKVDLITYADQTGEDIHAWDNEYIRTSHLTKSLEYTPPGEFNAEYFVFGNLGVGEMKTSCGKEGEAEANCDDWYVEGTEFPFLQRGDAYDRENNPRNYDNLDDPENNPSDLINREKFGEVRTNELASHLSGTVELGDDIVWHNTGDITIGSEEMDDVVTFSGGQSRIYTEGDVYIKADIKYETSSSSNYNDITSVRIDARNIYVDGEVEDLEVMLLAREGFHSGVSKKQLRILGDVIAKNTFWEREPLLEYDVEEVNKPSEYIIEDMRKYIVPAPGDTELPDDYTIWRQVNPATGEVLDSY